MYKPPRGSSGHKALGLIHAAATAAFGGNLERAKKHVEAAHVHVGNHVKELTVGGHHESATEFNGAAQKLLIKLDHLMKSKSKFARKSESDGDLSKAVNPNRKPPIATSATAGTDKAQVNRTPGHDARYNYKRFDQMKPSDQNRAQHSFGDRDMQSHMYPHDKASGEMVYGQRWKAPQDLVKPPQADEHYPAMKTPQIQAQHRLGAGVRINAEGHEHNGKLGIVQSPNPSMPGKSAVQIWHKGIKTTVHVEPNQVKLSALAGMKKSEKREAASRIVTLHKSRDALGRILKKNGV